MNTTIPAGEAVFENKSFGNLLQTCEIPDKESIKYSLNSYLILIVYTTLSRMQLLGMGTIH
jgi:hypothetical protein